MYDTAENESKKFHPSLQYVSSHNFISAIIQFHILFILFFVSMDLPNGTLENDSTADANHTEK